MGTKGRYESSSLSPGDLGRRRWARSQVNHKVPPQLSNLAASPPGHMVQVDEIAFESVREYCSNLGIRPGTRLLCRGEDRSGAVLADEPGGNTIPVPRDYALFVWVRKI